MSKPVVICVDDDPIILDSLKIELKRLLGKDCLVETAEGGEEALALFEELRREDYEVAVVLADYIMPGLKGDELLKQIHDLSPKTLNIMISGQADLGAIGNAIRDARLYRYISKPWQPQDLSVAVVEAIQTYLQDRKFESQSLELQETNHKLKQLYQHIEQLNISLEKQVEERTIELQQKIQEIEKLSQLKEDFLYAVSHDLRTPLMGMLLVMKKLQNQPGETISMSRSILNRMVESSDRQLQMLESLLEAQFSESQGMTLDCQLLNLREFVQAIVPDLEPLLHEDQATLINQIPPNLPSIVADPDHLRRVFENLITNALKHNPPGIRITLQAELAADSETQNSKLKTQNSPLVCCHIQDNGIGMTPTERSTLFDRYTQGKRSSRSIGIGLGLYLCRQIITAHGGQIGVNSVPNQGSDFWFTLPVQQ
jgi:two-component system, sensor histidine kinase and response regulator